MSKAFTKDDGPEAPIVPRPRAPLPAGVPNYVTARGLRLLRGEREALERERADAAAYDEPERARRLAALAQRLGELDARLASAQLVDPRAQSRELVRFGATVTLRGEDGEVRRITIVGVDEADASQGRVAFLAPIARAVLGLRVGDVATLRTGRGQEELEVLTLEYGDAAF